MRRFATNTFTAFALLSLTVAVALLAGCGSGGKMSSQVLSGNASAGAPLAGQVSIKDSSSPPQQKTTVIGSDGSFAFDVADLKAPYILQGAGKAAGTDYKLHSFGDGAGLANVNPLSNAMVASAAGVNDPEQIFAAPDPAMLQKIRSGLPAVASDLLGKLQPLLTLYNATGRDPIRDHYNSDHQGLDGLFDNVKITIPNGVITVANAKTGAMIFTAAVTDIKNGQFVSDQNSLPQPSSLPAGPAMPADPATPATPTAPTTPVVPVVPATPTAPAVPAAPAGVIATGGTGQTAISWNRADAAVSYNVYYSTKPGVTTASGTKLANAVTPAVHAGLADATTYYYIVTAVNSAGESAASVQVAATTLAPAPSPAIPATPTGASAAGGASQATLSWTAVSGANSYNIYWSTNAGITAANGTKIAGVTSPYVQTGLAAATTYYYVITAVNGAGESPASARITAATNAPAAPVAKQLSLTWDPVADAASYNLYWSTAPGVTTANGTKISGIAKNSYVHTGLAAGVTYYYVVTAVNSTSESAASAPASGATAL